MRGIVERHMLRKTSLARISEGSPLLGASTPMGVTPPEGSPSLRQDPSLHGASSLRQATARQSLLRQDSSVSSSSGTATPGNGEAAGRYTYGAVSESPREQ